MGLSVVFSVRLPLGLVEAIERSGVRRNVFVREAVEARLAGDGLGSVSSVPRSRGAMQVESEPSVPVGEPSVDARGAGSVPPAAQLVKRAPGLMRASSLVVKGKPIPK